MVSMFRPNLYLAKWRIIKDPTAIPGAGPYSALYAEPIQPIIAYLPAINRFNSG